MIDVFTMIEHYCYFNDLYNLRTELWCLAKWLSLTPGQTEVKVEFAVPIVACNMILEFVDFYEAQRAATEQLHCPRCSTSVPANPGSLRLTVLFFLTLLPSK